MSTPSPVINGQTGAHEQPVKFGRDTSGPYVERTWHGTRAAITAQYNLCVAGGGVCEVTTGIGVDKLTARFSIQQDTGGGTTEVPVDQWEFLASHVEKDVLEADVTFSPALTDHDKKQLKNYLVNPPASPSDVAAWDNATGSNLFELMENGLRSITVNAPTLRHTQTVSNVYTVRAALTNVGKIISSSTLMISEAIPTTVLFNLPFDTVKRSFGGGLSYGWRKMHPSVTIAARSKLQITQEWEYGLWSNLLYGAAL